MKKSIISRALLLAFTLTAAGACLADSVMKAEFRTMQECLASIKAHSGSSLKVVRDKPDIVTGNLSNGKTFACEKKETGTKGTYYEGWYMVKD
ncbi:hypothetical protein N6P31_12320 [Pectobacterium betavasculorum]|uniref:hypothetical protein n=1 Tax=Pectobacterium betavasculorum TaxID=55207 RepID=UPI00313B1738